MGIAHWDEVVGRRAARGRMSATWQDLGRAAGSYRAGVRRIRMDPGEIPTPVHAHGEAEEIFYVLGGSGVSWLEGRTCEVRAGDCIVYPIFEAHTLRGGDDGLDVLAFGAREYPPLGELPRAGVFWSVTGFTRVEQGHPWDLEPELEFPEPSERPETIVATTDVEPDVRAGRRRRDLGRAAGSRWTGLRHVELEPGTLSGPPHCHSAEEEIFVVLDGAGTLELTPPGLGEEPRAEPVSAGHVVARPPGTGVAHAFRAGDEGLTLLAWGTREPNDMCWYPRSRKVFWRGLGVAGRVEPLDYWEGEEL